MSAAERRERLKQVYLEARDCTRCQLHTTRTTVVFGMGNADAELMFVGEAPGANEDKQGLPFVGQAGKLLEKLLNEIGMQRADVFIANTLKCRPPGNRDPLPKEIETCEPYLRQQVELIQPTMICTLGNFATKLLRGDPTGISRLHGQEQILQIGDRAVRLYPLYHPAAALYTPSTLEMLRADFHRIPEILALGAPPQPTPLPPMPELAEDDGPDPFDGAPDFDEYGQELRADEFSAPTPSAPTPSEPAPQPAPTSEPAPTPAPVEPPGQDTQLGLFDL